MATITYDFDNCPYKVYFKTLRAKDIVNVIAPDDARLRKDPKFFKDLRESVESEGVRNPLFLSYVSKFHPINAKERYNYYLGNGEVFRYLKERIPEENLEDQHLLICNYGGSRLYVSSKKNIEVPCFVNDLCGAYKTEEKPLDNFEEVAKRFKDKPEGLSLGRRGLTMKFFKGWKLAKTKTKSKTKKQPY